MVNAKLSKREILSVWRGRHRAKSLFFPHCGRSDPRLNYWWGPFSTWGRWDSGICGTPHLNQQEVKFEAFSTTRLKAQAAWMVFHSSLLNERLRTDLPNSGVYLLQVSNMEAPHEIVLWFIFANAEYITTVNNIEIMRKTTARDQIIYEFNAVIWEIVFTIEFSIWSWDLSEL